MSVFDGLPDIFTETFGEPVVYRPAAGGTLAITAIWIERPIAAVVSDSEVLSDDIAVELHVRAADVTPKEGDIVTRSGNGKHARVVAPIRPDDKGMIACALEPSDPPPPEDGPSLDFSKPDNSQYIPVI